MQNDHVLIIAAVTSRPYVKLAAEAGYDVIAIDAFADVDTQKLAKQSFQVAYDGCSLDYQAIFSILDTLDLVHVDGFCYGAGFEAHPEILREIGQRVLVLGNTPEVVAQCKSPQYFFELCRKLNMHYPDYTSIRPKQTHGWLKKRIGGSGGLHVSIADESDFEDEQFYYQKMQSGLPVSCLFLATQQGVLLIGINEQWITADNTAPFRYGGAVSHAVPTGLNNDELLNFLNEIAQSLNLVGLNSCDFILDHNVLYVLEINPRLSASIDLYKVVQSNLFSAHIYACMHNKTERLVIGKDAKAHQVIYARNDVVIAENQVWPEWVCDIPNHSKKISAGMPLCTVTAVAENAEQAKKLVKERAVFI